MSDFNSHSNAMFSANRKHRYALWRTWDMTKSKVLFIGLNPSRGNEYFNDPTLKRCISFAQSWGFGGMLFGNLFSMVSPDPDLVRDNLCDAFSIETNQWLKRMHMASELTVVCWGSWDFTEERADEVIAALSGNLKCFGLNQDGSPKHPLYLPKNSTLIEFNQ